MPTSPARMWRCPISRRHPPLPDVAPGASYSEQLTTVLGIAPTTFSVADGALPPGVALSSTSLVRGVTNISGTFDFTVAATDTAGESSEQLYVLRVLQSTAAPADMVAWWRGEPAAGNTVREIIGNHEGGFFSGSSATSASYTPTEKWRAVAANYLNVEKALNAVDVAERLYVNCERKPCTC
jgi:hypothetical protein